MVYQGHHGDRGAARADVILPGSAYVEKPGTYVNTEGRVQRGCKACSRRARRGRIGRSCARSRAVIDKPLPYDTLDALRTRLEQVNPVFGTVGILPRFGADDLTAPGGDPAAVSDAPFAVLCRLLPDQPDQPGERRDGGVHATYAPAARAMAAE